MPELVHDALLGSLREARACHCEAVHAPSVFVHYAQSSFRGLEDLRAYVRYHVCGRALCKCLHSFSTRG